MSPRSLGEEQRSRESGGNRSLRNILFEVIENWRQLKLKCYYDEIRMFSFATVLKY